MTSSVQKQTVIEAEHLEVDSWIRHWFTHFVGEQRASRAELSKKYWNYEQLDLWIQKMIEGPLKFTSKGSRTFQVHSEI